MPWFILAVGVLVLPFFIIYWIVKSQITDMQRKMDRRLKHMHESVFQQLNALAIRLEQIFPSAPVSEQSPQEGLPPQPEPQPEPQPQQERPVEEQEAQPVMPVSPDQVQDMVEAGQEESGSEPSEGVPMAAPVAAHQEPRSARMRSPSKFEETVQDILRKIWSWILVGEDYRPQNVAMEYAVASTWLMRLGIVALVICVGYFLKWTMDQGLLGPMGRIAFSVIAGIGMLILGLKHLKGKYHILAQGFLGGGIATLYFSMFAAGPMYHKVPLVVAFLLMCLVTVVAGTLSVKTNSQLIAILGIIGGFFTPIMLQVPNPSLGILYGYMLLLGLGILGIAYARQWRLLNYLGFALTWILFFLSLSEYHPVPDFTVTISFLTLLFILHAVIVYYYNLSKGQTTTALEITHLLLNAGFFAWTSYHLILDRCGRPWPAVMAIGMAAFYVAHIFVFLRKRIKDRNLLITLIGVAGFFTVWAVPLITSKETLTICWAIQAFFYLWIGLKLNSNLLITLSHLLFLLVMGRMTLLDMPERFAYVNWKTVPMVEYWKVFAERLWTFGVVIATFFGAFVLLRREVKKIPAFAVEEENNTPVPVPRSVCQETMFWCGVGFLFVFLCCEFFQMFTYYEPLQMPVLTVLCCGLGLYFLFDYTCRGYPILLKVASVVLALTLIKLFILDCTRWIFIRHGMVYHSGGIGLFMRLLDYGFIFFFVMLLLKIVAPRRELDVYRKSFTVISTALLFIYASLEVNSFFHWYVAAFQQGAISVLWAMFAIAYLIIGLRKSSKAWRYSGLVLFSVVGAKVFLIDLADMEVIYRVIAFMILGLLLLGGSFAYIQSNKKFKIEQEGR